jgi:hypothetical protein
MMWKLLKSLFKSSSTSLNNIPLHPSGIAYTVVPEDYLLHFPYNDVEEMSRKNTSEIKLIIIK